MSGGPWKLSPSDFSFLWEECRRCFYLKTVSGFNRPRQPMPKIFTAIDATMKAFYQRLPTSEIDPGLPRGVLLCGDRWVQSQPVELPGHSGRCYLRGKLDALIEFVGGGYGVVDFKTSHANGEHVALYARQLHAYAYALEHAAPGNLALAPVRKLGLVVFEPERFSASGGRRGLLAGKMTWIEIARDDGAFRRFLGEVLYVLEGRSPPPPSPTCEWCRYREAGRRRGV